MTVYTALRAVPERCGLTGGLIGNGADLDLAMELQCHCRIKRYSAGDIVVGEGEENYFFGYIVSGVVGLRKTLLDGRQQIVGLLLPDDIFGRLFAPVSHVSVEAATDITLCCCNRPEFERLLLRFPALEHRVLLSSLNELDAAQNWMMLLGCKTVMERIATFLLIVWRRQTKPPEHSTATSPVPTISIPIRRTDMASYLGTTVESISRSIRELTRQRVLRIVDAQHFEILNERRLIWLSGHEGPEVKSGQPGSNSLKIEPGSWSGSIRGAVHSA